MTSSLLISNLTLVGTDISVNIKEKIVPGKWKIDLTHSVRTGYVLIYRGDTKSTNLSFPSIIEGKSKIKLGRNKTSLPATVRIDQENRLVSLIIGSASQPLIIPTNGSAKLTFEANIDITLDGTVEPLPPPSIPPNNPSLPDPPLDNIFHPVFLPEPKMILDRIKVF